MKHLYSTYIFLLSTVMMVSCATNPYAPTNKAHKKQSKTLVKELSALPPPQPGTASATYYADDWVGTTNFSLRKPNLVIIHHTAQDSVEQTLNTFILPRTQVSSHYVIAANGKIYQMLNDLYRAWHGGSGKWGSNSDINSSSIGIELDNNGFEEFSPLQIKSLMILLKDLKDKYKIPAANFIGHADIAPTRKSDPNKFFPWKALAEEGFGLWYDDVLIMPLQTVLDSPIVNANIPQDLIDVGNDTVTIAPTKLPKPPSLLDVSPKVALKIIGYDVSDLPAAIKAFKLHFIQTEVDSTLTDYDLKVLNNLYKKYL